MENHDTKLNHSGLLETDIDSVTMDTTAGIQPVIKQEQGS